MVLLSLPSTAYGSGPIPGISLLDTSRLAGSRVRTPTIAGPTPAAQLLSYIAGQQAPQDSASQLDGILGNYQDTEGNLAAAAAAKLAGNNGTQAINSPATTATNLPAVAQIPHSSSTPSAPNIPASAAPAPEKVQAPKVAPLLTPAQEQAQTLKYILGLVLHGGS